MGTSPASDKSGCSQFFLNLFGGRKPQAALPVTRLETLFPDSQSASLDYDRFIARNSLLSNQAEREFYKALRTVVGAKFIIMCEVGMGSIFTVKNQYEPGWQSLRNKIERKRLDFLLCNPDTLQIRIAIELDGFSHRDPKRAERDEELDQIFAAAGLPLLHFTPQPEYDLHQIAAKIKAVMRG